jgi:hypothetical protein
MSLAQSERRNTNKTIAQLNNEMKQRILDFTKNLVIKY